MFKEKLEYFNAFGLQTLVCDPKGWSVLFLPENILFNIYVSAGYYSYYRVINVNIVYYRQVNIVYYRFSWFLSLLKIISWYDPIFCNSPVIDLLELSSSD